MGRTEIRSPSKITNLKRKAKNMSLREGKILTHCLNELAIEHGYKSWSELMGEYNKNQAKKKDNRWNR